MYSSRQYFDSLSSLSLRFHLNCKLIGPLLWFARPYYSRRVVTLLYSANGDIGMPRHLLHQLFGPDNPSRSSSGGLEEYRCVLGGADNGARDVYSIHLLEQLGDDESDLQQETRSGEVTVHRYFDRGRVYRALSCGLAKHRHQWYVVTCSGTLCLSLIHI